MSIETMTKIDSYTVGSGGIASVTFSNIPQHYTDLKIVISARDTNANSGNFFANIVMLLNSDSNTQNYGWTLGYSLSGTMAAISTGLSGGYYVIYNPSSTATASTFGNSQTTILNYSSNRYKPISDESQAEGNSLATFLSISTGIWRNTSPVTSLTFQSMTLFAQHSTITVYGVKSMKKAIGNSIKATGGAISFDGTYVYHNFNSSETFTPTSNLTADIVVVAGGGGGGNYSGGGAGGLLGFTSQYVTSIPYTVTIGSGGVSGTLNTPGGTNGSDSQFGSLTLVKGGGGGAASSNNTNGSSGGSGGGGSPSYNGFGWSSGISTGGSATSGQGNNGGSGTSYTTNPSGISGGGGGGAGAVGGNASTNIGGNGGIGSSTYSSWGFGEQVGGIRYLAGGGAGLSNGGTNGTRGSGGGGAVAGTGGMANTGGGAGAQGNNGGSGIVIIRYKA